MPKWGDVMTHHEDVNGAMSCAPPSRRCKATLCKPAGSQSKFMTDGQNGSAKLCSARAVSLRHAHSALGGTRPATRMALGSFKYEVFGKVRGSRSKFTMLAVRSY